MNARKLYICAAVAATLLLLVHNSHAAPSDSKLCDLGPLLEKPERLAEVYQCPGFYMVVGEERVECGRYVQLSTEQKDAWAVAATTLCKKSESCQELIAECASRQLSGEQLFQPVEPPRSREAIVTNAPASPPIPTSRRESTSPSKQRSAPITVTLPGTSSTQPRGESGVSSMPQASVPTATHGSDHDRPSPTPTVTPSLTGTPQPPRKTPSPPTNAKETRKTLPNQFIVKFRAPEVGEKQIRDVVQKLRQLRISESALRPVFRTGARLSFSRMSQALSGNQKAKSERAKNVARFNARMQRAPRKNRSSSLERIYEGRVPKGQTLDNVLKVLSQSDAVEYVQPVYVYQLTEDPNPLSFNDPRLAELWGIARVQAPAAWSISQGEGVTVGVIDSGIDIFHEDLSANIWINTHEVPNNCIDDDNNGYVDDIHGYDFNGNSDNASWCGGTATYNKVADPVGHGTHVAGTIGAVGNNGVGVVGVAPKARLMAVKGLDRSGGSSLSLAAAIEYAVENGADILNNSWGTAPDGADRLIEEALAEAYDMGVLSVFALGNSKALVTSTSFLARGNTLNVAASDQSDARWTSSNYGPYTHVAAPGVAILSSATAADAKGGPPYTSKNGTSMAAPHVAGVAALVLSANPTLDHETIHQLIAATADDVGPIGFDENSGAGVVNAAKAVQVAKLLIDDDRALPHVSILTPRDGSVFSSFSESQTIAVKLAAAGDLKALRLEYRVKSQTTAPWQPITVTASADASQAVGYLKLASLTPETYVIRASAQSTRLELSARDSVEFTVDYPGVVTLGRFPQGSLDRKTLDITDRYVSWNEKKTVENREKWSVHIVDLAGGAKREVPARATAEHLIASQYLYYIDTESVLGVLGQSNPHLGVNRFDLATGENIRIDSPFNRQGAAVRFFAALDGYDERVLWFQDEGDLRTLKIYSPAAGIRQLMTASINSSLLTRPRMVGNSVLVVSSVGDRDKLLRIDASTGVADAAPLLDLPNDFSYPSIFLTKSAPQRILVQHLEGDFLDLRLKIFEYNDSTKSVQFLFERPLPSQVSLTNTAMISAIPAALETLPSSVVSTDIASGVEKTLSTTIGEKNLLDSQGDVTVWSDSAPDGSTWIKLHAEPDQNGFLSSIPPIFAEPTPQTAKERTTLSVQLTAYHARGGTVMYDAKVLPSGATLDSTTGTFTWTPSPSQIGAHTVRFIAYDPAQPSSQASIDVPITVLKNNAPVIEEIPPQTAFVGTLFRLCPTVYDPDLERLVIRVQGLPTGARFVESARCLEWTPTEADIGSTHSLEISADDGIDTTVRKVPLVVEGSLGDLTVSDIYIQWPGIRDFNSLVAYSNQPVQFEPVVTNLGSAASANTTVRISLEGPQPWSTNVACAPLAPQERLDLLSEPWVPKVGVYTVRVTIDPDNTQAESNENNNELTIPLYVEQVNNPPSITLPATVEAYTGNTIRFKIESSDPDGDPVLVELLQAPSGAAVTANNEFVWTPQEHQAGVHSVSVMASDVPAVGIPQATVQQTTITVLAAPKAPPTAPLGLTYTASYDPKAQRPYTATFNWRDTSVNESAFVVEVASASGGGYSPVRREPSNATRSTVTALAPGNYIFRVCAVNSYGQTCSIPIKVPLPVRATPTPLVATPAPPPIP